MRTPSREAPRPKRRLVPSTRFPTEYRSVPQETLSCRRRSRIVPRRRQAQKACFSLRSAARFPACRPSTIARSHTPRDLYRQRMLRGPQRPRSIRVQRPSRRSEPGRAPIQTNGTGEARKPRPAVRRRDQRERWAPAAGFNARPASPAHEGSSLTFSEVATVSAWSSCVPAAATPLTFSLRAVLTTSPRSSSYSVYCFFVDDVDVKREVPFSGRFRSDLPHDRASLFKGQSGAEEFAQDCCFFN